MAWLYLPSMEFLSSLELQGLTSALNESSQKLEPFAMSRGKCLERSSFIRRCKKDSYTLHPSIPMLSPSHPLLITSLKKWISSQPVSHVNLSVPPVQEREPKTNVGFGNQYLKPLARFDQTSYSWRTFQTSLMNGGHLTKFLRAWPKSGSILNGQMYERAKLGPIIKETVYSFSHTKPEPLIESIYPTPTASHGKRTSKTYGGGNLTLFGKVSLLPTPTASDPLKHSTGGLHRLLVQGRRKSSETRQHLLPTPTTNDGQNHTFPKSQSKRDSLVGKIMKQPSTISQVNGGKGNRLSPLFVEWMMGFPTGWTDLEP